MSNPIEMTRKLREEFSSYIATEYKVDDPDYQRQIQKQLETFDLYNGPFLKTTLPFLSTEDSTIRNLVKNGLIHQDFLKSKSLNLDRPLYAHQEKALEIIQSGKSLIVTTGTGSGKTESFLYPILDHILKVKNSGNKKPGVKALLIYPMNALVNDQLDRFESILKDFPDITFGKYIGETVNRFTEREKTEYYGEHPKNDLGDRESMRNNPPDILVTNYSMLEYILIRPKDNAIINKESLSDWQFLVIDEAHMYSGTKGAEIAHLFRRLCGFADRIPQFILTSATLGDTDSVNEIARFGKNLTGSDFSAENILFASRKPLDEKLLSYRIAANVYSSLMNELNSQVIDSSKIYSLISHYSDKSSIDFAEYFNQELDENQLKNLVFDLLVQDRNTFVLYKSAENTINFEELKSVFSDFSEKELLDLIDLITYAQSKDGKMLFDAKYHFFIKSPNRAYISLEPKKEIVFGNHTEIDGLKAFEVGRCSNCNHLFIIGRIVNDYLEQDDSIDIYENYEDSQFMGLQFFSLTEEDDDDGAEEYIVCSKCGMIHPANKLNANWCDCGENYRVHLWRFVASGSGKVNNLTQCPHCSWKNTVSGVIHSFRLNQDRATSIIGNIYLNALSRDKELPVSVKTETGMDLFGDDLFSEPADEKAKKTYVPQILAFSDSRQQASTFAVRMDETHEKMLTRKLIKNIAEEGSISIVQAAAKLAHRFEADNLFEEKGNNLHYSSYQARAWGSLLRDLLLLDGNSSAESIGLYYFSVDLTSIKALLENSEKYKTVIKNKFKLSVSDFVTLIEFCIQKFRSDGVIDYSRANLTETEEQHLLGHKSIRKGVTLQSKDSKNKNLVNFVPLHNKRETLLTGYLSKISGVSNQEAQAIAKELFTFLVNVSNNPKTKLLQKANFRNENGYQIPLESFVLNPVSSSSWYRCSKCGRITRLNIKDVCPRYMCSGHLEPCSLEEVFKDSYLRNETINIPEVRRVTEEHTAQLKSHTAKEYQRRFKNKEINLLSCSTTFEVGVDLGSLENVFLRNVPPTPANYVQRAGRAGRGKDASALVVTYCLAKSHDYSHYTNPRSMINGTVVPPVFSVVNQKLVLRHITSTAFGFYFRNYPKAFDSGTLVFDENLEPFLEYLNSKPEDLGIFIDTYILKEEKLRTLRNYKWLDIITKDDFSSLNLFINETKGIIQDLKEQEQEQSDLREHSLADYFKNRIEGLKKKKMLDLLSEGAVIPKYGFPVDVVSLKPHYRLNCEDYELDRDLKVAISEYAPGSEVIVDKKKVTSRYINLPRSGSLETYYYATCKDCNTTTIQNKPFTKESTCKTCGHSLQLNSGMLNRQFLIPALGFTTSAVYGETSKNPVKSFTGSVEYLGGGIIDEKLKSIYKDSMEVQAISDDKMVLMNKSDFFMCPKCGYTEKKIDSNKNYIAITKQHMDPSGRSCYGDVSLNQKGRLNRITLGHMFKTDVVKITFLNRKYNRDELITLGYALLEGLARTLQVERMDLDTVIAGDSLLLFDNVPGGAGYVKNMVYPDKLEKILKAALRVVSSDCCSEETTCPNCLRNYYNQSHHKVMKRKYAREILTSLLDSEVA